MKENKIGYTFYFICLLMLVVKLTFSALNDIQAFEAMGLHPINPISIWNYNYLGKTSLVFLTLGMISLLGLLLRTKIGYVLFLIFPYALIFYWISGIYNGDTLITPYYSILLLITFNFTYTSKIFLQNLNLTNRLLLNSIAILLGAISGLSPILLL